MEGGILGAKDGHQEDSTTKTHLEPRQTSNMEPFVKQC